MRALASGEFEQSVCDELAAALAKRPEGMTAKTFHRSRAAHKKTATSGG